MERLFRQVLRFKWLIILAVITVTVILALQIPGIRINSDVVSSLPDYDKDAVLLKKIGEKFGGNKTGMVILETENVFTNTALKHVRQITDTLSEIDGVTSVMSLTNVMDVRSGSDGLEIGRLTDEDDLPDSPEELNRLKERALSSDNFKGTLVSDDGTTAIIIFSITDEVNMLTAAKNVKTKIDGISLPEKIYYAGSPMMIASIAHMISADLARLLPIAFLLISLVLFFGFRSLRGVVIPLLTAALSIVWVIGIMAVAGSDMSMVSNNIPIVLLAVGTAYAIHVVNRIDQLKEDLNRAIVVALSYVTVPVILAALTTITGFISFIFGSYLKMIREFGIYTAIGTFFALILSLFFVPALISAFSWKGSVRFAGDKDDRHSFFARNFRIPLHNLLFHNTKAILIFWVVITIVNIGGIFLIKRNVDIRNYFRKGNPTRVAENIMAGKFGGTKPVFVLFSGDIQSPEVLNMMLKTENYLKQDPGISVTQSVAGLIADINGALGEGRKIPEDKEKVEQLWFLFEGNENLEKLVSDDLDEAVIITRFLPEENSKKIEFAKNMKKFIDENSTPGCRIEVTGMPFIDVTMDRSLIFSQMGSLLIAMVFVIIIVSLILRSFSAGIFAVIPILSTIIILFGVMGYTGIPLNIATVLVASIAMGIGIDYSIHVVTHFNSHIRDGATISGALDETIRVSGKAIIINVISVSSGFLVLLFSEMVPLQYFGLLIALSMVGSGLSAMTLLPAILIQSLRRRKIALEN